MFQDWSLLEQIVDVNEAIEYFMLNLYSLFDKYVPRYRYQKSKYPKWYTKDLIKLIRQKGRLHQKYKKTGLPHYLVQFKDVRSRIKAMVRDCFGRYVRDVESNLVLNPSLFWSFFNTKNVILEFQEL